MATAVRAVGIVLAMALASLGASCGGDGAAPTPTAPATLEVTSNVFPDGGDIPAAYGCDGDGISPDLAWTGVPPATRSLAVIALDPDAHNFVHWLVYGIPAGAVTIPAGVTNEPQLLNGARQGKNSFGDTGYGAPCPPKGSTHTYRFYVYALDSEVTLDSGSSLDDVNAAIAGHVLAKGLLPGRFGR